MSRQVLLVALSAAVAVGLAINTSTAEAGHCGGGKWKPTPPPIHLPPPIHWKPQPPTCPPVHHPAPTYPAPTHPRPAPAPTYTPAPQPAPQPTTSFRPISFPSQPQPSVVPSRTWYFGVSLEIADTVYGRGLRVASVTRGGPGAMAGLERGDVLMVANGQSLSHATTNEHGVQILQSLVNGSSPAPTAAFVVPSSPTVQFGVVDRRTNSPTYVTVTPQRVGGSPAPTAGGGGGGFPAPSQAFPSAPAASAAPEKTF